MNKFFVVILLSFLLYGCAGTDKVIRKNNDDVLGRVYITNGSGAAAVFIDDSFVGNTPIDVKLSVGEHHLIMNLFGNVVLDTTIIVTDDYNRNTNAGVVGGLIAGFIPLLLVPFPINMLLAPLSTWIVGSNVTKFNKDKIAREPYKEYNVKSESLQKFTDTKNFTFKGTDLAHYYKDSAVYVNGAAMHFMDVEKIRFLRQKKDEKDTIMVGATYLCYETSSDLVWVASPGSGTSVFQTDEFIPCEIDSLPYSDPFVSAGKRMGAVVGAFGLLGLVAGQNASSALISMFVGGSFFGLPTLFISDHVLSQRNIHACQKFRSKPLVKQWYRQYPCRQNTNPIPESKNQ